MSRILANRFALNGWRGSLWIPSGVVEQAPELLGCRQRIFGKAYYENARSFATARSATSRTLE